MVKVYCIAQIRACDKEQLSESAGTAGPTVAQYGGLSAKTDPNTEHCEAKLRWVAASIKFGSMDDTKTLYQSDEHTEAKVIGDMPTEKDLLLVEGVLQAAPYRIKQSEL